MERKEFLALLGLGAGAALTGCLGGCKKDDTAPSGVDFTLDLNDSANAALNTPGGYVYSHNVIVARTLGGSFVAVQQSCTHEGTTLRYLNPSRSDVFYCNNHGAEFSPSGSVVRQPSVGSATNLKTYSVTQSGTTLHVKG